jgi:uncharacterized membrane protein (DUF2068 family)
MKRSLISKLALAWCWFYSLMLLGSVALALRRSTDSTVFATLIPFAAMLYGSIGLYRQKRWAPWICAGTLALLTLWLPFGYMRIASLPGKDPNRLLVTFSVWTFLNLIVVAYLVRRGYRVWRMKNDEE